MPYAIGSIVFGVTTPGYRDRKEGKGNVALAEALEKAFPGERDYLKEERLGWEHVYEGPSEKWFGIRLGELDECNDYELDKLPKVTPEVVARYNAKLAKLPKSVQDAMPPPKWQIVWRSS